VIEYGKVKKDLGSMFHMKPEIHTDDLDRPDR